VNLPEQGELELGDGRRAVAVERPDTIDALCDAVTRHIAQEHAIYPQGGRTALDYGGSPTTPGVAIDVRAIARVVDYPAADMTITVEAGMTLAALQETLATEGQRLPLDAPEAETATLGGIFATNTSGPRRFGAGRPRDLIIGIRFVSGEGKVIKGGGRVVKNVAGYDLPKLMTGSMGTLGIIAELTLKVRPAPESTAVVLTTMERLHPLAGLLDHLNTSATRPMAIEVWNGHAAKLIEPADSSSSTGWTLAVGFEDSAVSVAWQRDALQRERTGRDARVVVDADAKILWKRMADFPSAVSGDVGFVANLRPSSLTSFLAAIDARHWAVQAHAGSGIVRAFLLGELGAPAITEEIAHLRALAVADGGNLVLSRCPAEWKSSLRIWGEPRGDAFLARKVKQAIDPRGVMNPGRLAGIIE
jgi:glycolate oxidase FAD binding subunit